jgi:hypothetical protein
MDVHSVSPGGSLISPSIARGARFWNAKSMETCDLREDSGLCDHSF